jgi:nicotinate dehydrogenase subunit A
MEKGHRDGKYQSPVIKMTGAAVVGINGKSHAMHGDPDQMLLDFLRDDLGLTATRFGCGEGSCGACMILVEGRAMTACNLPVSAIVGKQITTLEGLGDESNQHPLQQAFIHEQAMQCGYCISGIIMSAAALLRINANPTDIEIKAALDNNLCRCGSHLRIIKAVQRAAAVLRDRA